MKVYCLFIMGGFVGIYETHALAHKVALKYTHIFYDIEERYVHTSSNMIWTNEAKHILKEFKDNEISK